MPGKPLTFSTANNVVLHRGIDPQKYFRAEQNGACNRKGRFRNPKIYDSVMDVYRGG